MIACFGGDTSGHVPGAFLAQFLSLVLWKAPAWEQFSGCDVHIDKRLALNNLNWVSLFHPPYWTKWRNIFHLVANRPVASWWQRLNTNCVVAVDMLAAILRPDCVARCFCHMAQKVFSGPNGQRKVSRLIASECLCATSMGGPNLWASDREGEVRLEWQDYCLWQAAWPSIWHCSVPRRHSCC